MLLFFKEGIKVVSSRDIGVLLSPLVASLRIEFEDVFVFFVSLERLVLLFFLLGYLLGLVHLSKGAISQPFFLILHFVSSRLDLL